MILYACPVISNDLEEGDTFHPRINYVSGVFENDRDAILCWHFPQRCCRFTSLLVVFTSFIYMLPFERSSLSIMACIMKLYKALKGAAISHQVLLAMTFIQFGFAGMTLISKAALNAGMNPLVFNAYRQMIATLVLALLVLLMERLVLFFSFLSWSFHVVLLSCLAWLQVKWFLHVFHSLASGKTGWMN